MAKLVDAVGLGSIGWGFKSLPGYFFIYNMTSKVGQRLVSVKAYFVACSGTFKVYSNFFLIGGRNNFALIRLQALVDQLRRLTLFLKVCAASAVEFWLISTDSRRKRFLWWLSGAARLPFLFKTQNMCGLFICKWRGRCFLGEWRDFGFKMRNFVGMDAILMVGAQDFKDEIFGAFLHKFNAATLYLSEPDLDSDFATFPLFCATSQPALLVYYSRVFLAASCHF